MTTRPPSKSLRLAPDTKRLSLRKLLNPVIGIVNHWKRSRLRHVMRGHRVLKKRGNLGLIAEIQSELTEKQLGIDPRTFALPIFGAAAGAAELVVRQYLLLRIGGLSLNGALLAALARPKAKLVYPMPAQWRSVLEKHGFRLSHWRCELLWKLYALAAWGYGVLQIGRVIVGAITSTSDSTLPRESYVYFMDLNGGNLPQQDGAVSSHDIVSWYLQWHGRDRQITSVRHSVATSRSMEVGGVSVRAQSGPLPSLSGTRAVVLYLAWGGAAALSSLLSLGRGRWWNALLLNQAAQRAHAAALPVDSLAREYFFHNSRWLYRPLWTYELDSKQSRASLYFYSTNCERFKTSRGYATPYYGYRAMNWPHYLVWDRHQADFVRRAAGAASNISEVGPIWFSSNAKALPHQDGTFIALFDVTPFRHSRFCEIGQDNEFYTPAVANAFVKDAVAVSRRCGARILWKRKRNVGRAAHPAYRHVIQLLDQDSTVVLAAPEISAVRVIQSSAAVISMPFTSTALIAKSLGVPSAYYDPSGIVQKDDRGAHGIEVLIGRDELESWIKENCLDLRWRS